MKVSLGKGVFVLSAETGDVEGAGYRHLSGLHCCVSPEGAGYPNTRGRGAKTVGGLRQPGVFTMAS